MMAEEHTFKPSVLDTHSPGHWQILEHALSGRLSADNFFLVQWPPFASSLKEGGENLSELTGAVLEAVKSETQCEALCLPFDESSVMVIVGESASHFLDRCAHSLSDHLRQSVHGTAAPDADGKPAYWIPVDRDQISLRFRRHGSGTTAAGPVKSRLILPDADFFFFPLWDASENRLFAYLCRSFWEVPDRGRLTEAAPEVAAISPERLAAIDLTTFETASEFVQDAPDHYGPAEVVIPVHASLFESEAAVKRYFEDVDRAIWAIAEQVWFEVVCRIDEPGSRVATAIERLSRYGRPPLIRTDAKRGIPGEVLAAGVWSVGLEIDPKMPAGEKTAVLEAVQSGIATAGCRRHVIGLETAEETLEAINAGFDYIGSDALMPPLAAPGSAGFEAQPTDLLRTILASRSK